MILRNRDTGKLIEVGSRKKTLDDFLARRAKRLRAWERALHTLNPNTHTFKRVGLTYRPGETWQPLDITAYRQAVQEFLGDRLAAYMWWAELQPQRGVVHYHMVMAIRKGGPPLPHPDSSGMWRHGNSNTRQLERATVGYALSDYATKRSQVMGEFPRGMRKFAVWIAESAVPKADYWGYRLSTLPGWLELETLTEMATRGWHRPEVAIPWRDWLGDWWVATRRVLSPWEQVRWAADLAPSRITVIE